MNVADRELCRDLFILSKWGQGETHLTWYDGELGETEPWDRDADNRKAIPAYDLGYLLRKLPEDYGRGVSFQLCHQDNQWIAKYGLGLIDIEYAATPEDAACKLAIELFKQGVLS